MKNPYAFRPNTLYLGDCLEVMNAFVEAGQQVDLIYLDPPFNSDANYSMLFKRDMQGRDLDEQAQFTAFQDTWYWTPTAAERVENIKNAVGNPAQKVMIALDTMIPQTPMLAYLSYMAERLSVMHRLLKDTGSLYLHCDPTANSYLRIILDGIFGAKNYRNEIVWKRKYDTHNLAKKQCGRVHDTILWYAMSNATKYNKQFTEYSADYINTAYKHEDEKGRYRTLPCTNETGGNKPYTFKGITRAWRFTASRMQRMYDENLLVQSTPTSPFQYKKYFDDAEGVPIQDIWDDIKAVRGKGESLGYPTQKPLALLKRIIQASSNPGDIVLDPFAGCGTTAEASFRLGRKFLGIDISAYVIQQVCTARLKDAAGVKVMGLPTDMASAIDLAREKPFVFEQWAVTRIPGMLPNDKQTGDGGVDGRGKLLVKPIKDDKPESGLVFVQVKGGSFQPDSYRALLSQIIGGKASVGLFITLEKKKLTPSMQKAIGDAGTYTLPGGSRKFDRLMFWSVEEYFADVEPRLPELAHPISGKAMPRQIALTQKA